MPTARTPASPPAWGPCTLRLNPRNDYQPAPPNSPRPERGPGGTTGDGLAQVNAAVLVLGHESPLLSDWLPSAAFVSPLADKNHSEDHSRSDKNR